MAKAIEWERVVGGTYAWPLGLHYYAEDHGGGEWLPCLMIGETDVKEWDGVSTRAEAERIMQADFDARVSEWIR